jgi:hypothetical protein
MVLTFDASKLQHNGIALTFSLCRWNSRLEIRNRIRNDTTGSSDHNL